MRRVELAALLGEQLCLTLAQELERGAKAAARPQRALGDGALHAVVPGGEPDDLGGLAIAERREDDGGSGDEGHRSFGPSAAVGEHHLELASAAPGRPDARAGVPPGVAAQALALAQVPA